MTIDILMATHNGENYLADQLDSLIAQTFTDWRLLVSDDCSTDGTLDILHTYEKRDPRIKVVAQDVRKGGAKKNFWSLLSYAEGPYIMFCDQDDVWDEDKLIISLVALCDLEKNSKSEEPALAFVDMRVTDSELNVICGSFERFRNEFPPRIDFEGLLAMNEAAGCTMILNRKLLNMLREIHDPEKIIMHDWWAMLVAAAFGEISYIDVPLVDYRQHGANSLGAVSYSLARSLNPRRAVRSSRRYVRQGRAFLEAYGDRMNSHQREHLQHFISTLGGGPVGLYHLIKSGCWRKNLADRFMQVVSVLLLFPLVGASRTFKRFLELSAGKRA